MSANNKTRFEETFENTFELDESANVPAVPETKKEVKQNFNPKKSDIEDDYEFARENIYEIIGQGKEALEGLMAVAKEDENARTYEVLATLIKTLSETNKDLFDIQERNQKISKEIDKDESANKPSNNYTQNNVYVGSTAELQKALKGNGNN